MIGVSIMSIVATVRDNLLTLAGAYSSATGKSLTQISKEAYGKSSFFEDLKAGTRSLSIDKLERMIEWFRENWPAEADVPALRSVFMSFKRLR